MPRKDGGFVGESREIDAGTRVAQKHSGKFPLAVRDYSRPAAFSSPNFSMR